MICGGCAFGAQTRTLRTTEVNALVDWLRSARFERWQEER
jgi:hypothetical protein